MKKSLSEFANNLVPKQQMRIIKGGDDWSYCTIAGGNSSCYSSLDGAASACDRDPGCAGVQISRIE